MDKTTSLTQGNVFRTLIKFAVPVVLAVSRIPDVTLFGIGLATPASTFVQILLCLAFYVYVEKQNRKHHRI